jgi:hypothetical protein
VEFPNSVNYFAGSGIHGSGTVSHIWKILILNFPHV